MGRQGERRARRALRRAGYQILARNLHTPFAEIDLLCRQADWLVLVEVKCARSGSAPAHTRLEYAQRRRLAQALRWLSRRRDRCGLPVRVDLVAVTIDGRRSLVTILRDVVSPDLY